MRERRIMKRKMIKKANKIVRCPNCKLIMLKYDIGFKCDVCGRILRKGESQK